MNLALISASDLLSLVGAAGTIVLASVAILSGRKYIREERSTRKDRLLKAQRVEDALLGTQATDTLDATPSLFVRVSALSDNLDTVKEGLNTVKEGQEAIAVTVKQLLPNGGKSVSDQINKITNQVSTITGQITTMADQLKRLENHVIKEDKTPRPTRRQYPPKSKGTS